MKDISVVGAWLRALARGHFLTVVAPIGAVSVSERLPISTKRGGQSTRCKLSAVLALALIGVAAGCHNAEGGLGAATVEPAAAKEAAAAPKADAGIAIELDDGMMAN